MITHSYQKLLFKCEECNFCGPKEHTIKMHLKRSEFHHILIGTIIRVLIRNLRAQSEIGNHERDQRVSVQPEPSVPHPL